MIPILTAFGVAADTAGSIAAGVSTAAAVAGTAVSAIGAIKAGNQTAAVDNYNAQVEQQKAGIASDQSQDQAAIDAANTKRQMGQAAADFGAAGVDMTGTPLSVMSDLATQGELTRRLDIYKGQLTSASDTQQGVLDMAQGSAAKTASIYQAGSTLLTGAFNTGRNYVPGSSPTISSSPGSAMQLGPGP
jgi:hypothetical protein